MTSPERRRWLVQRGQTLATAALGRSGQRRWPGWKVRAAVQCQDSRVSTLAAFAAQARRAEVLLA
jgi:hypothetical protein